jgi:hypothetical protein
MPSEINLEFQTPYRYVECRAGVRSTLTTANRFSNQAHKDLDIPAEKGYPQFNSHTIQSSGQLPA